MRVSVGRPSKRKLVSILLLSTRSCSIHPGVVVSAWQPRLLSMSTSPKVWSDAKSVAISSCVPPLSANSHKGSSGRVGVLGGSARYTGAPYYASMASLKVGSDLSYVFCAREATIPIKCYSPELMVAGVYSAADFDEALEDQNEAEQDRLVAKMIAEVVSMMDRMHVLVIGPGMGRCPLVFRATAQIMRVGMDRNLPMVVDADALFLLTLPDYLGLFQNYTNVVFTPNVVEWKRLIDAHGGDVSQATAGIVVQKGAHDVISHADGTCLICEEEGGLKRSGGLGDILSGTIGTFLAWHEILIKRGIPTERLLSCWSACCVTRQATKRAYAEHKRSMTAPDVLGSLGATVDDMTTE
jgi:ATP-dependent NAD(P)H-hydrate dehydratase